MSSTFASTKIALPDEIKEQFPYLWQRLNEGEHGYLCMHAQRFQFTLQLAKQCLRDSPSAGETQRLLDFGPSVMTEILRHETTAIVNQIGYINHPAQPRPGEQHFEYDLDTTVNHADWPKLPPHDVLVAGEIVEHLHTSPNHWLPFLQSCLVPGGYMIITTPNGVTLKRRLMMLAGVHPYEMIHDDPKIPGHFREYTRNELAAFGAKHGLRLVRFSCRAHLDYPETLGQLYNLVTRCLPPSFRDTMYLVFKKEKTAAHAGV